MGLKEELKLYKEIDTAEHECLMNIVYTANLLSKAGYKFFASFGVTETQFNALMQLKYSEAEGVSQVVLSGRLLVNKADISGIIDRLEKQGMVERLAHGSDRRVKIVRITKKGMAVLKDCEAKYFKHVEQIMKEVTPARLKETVSGLELMRANMREGGLV